MVNSAHYGSEIDIWSIGCILAELLGRKVMFPGADYLKQITLIVKLLGTPDAADLENILPAARDYILYLGPKPKALWSERFPHAQAEALDLLDKLLRFNPGQRLTAHQALCHPYFDDLNKPTWSRLQSRIESITGLPASHAATIVAYYGVPPRSFAGAGVEVLPIVDLDTDADGKVIENWPKSLIEEKLWKEIYHYRPDRKPARKTKKTEV